MHEPSPFVPTITGRSRGCRGLLEAALPWWGGEGAKLLGWPLGTAWGVASKLLLEPGWGTSSAQTPREGPGLGAWSPVLGPALSVLPQPSTFHLSLSVSSSLT